MLVDYLFVAFSMALSVSVCYLLGAWVVPAKFFGAEVMLRGIARLGVGIGLFATYIFTVGHLGMLTKESILFFLLLVILLRISAWKQFGEWVRHGLLKFSSASPVSPEGLLLIVAFCFSFLLLGIPETGNDALCYQLHIPKLFARFESMLPLSYEINSYMPFGMNCLYTAGLLFHKVILAKAFHWMTAFLAAGLIFSLVRRLTRSSSWGWLAAAVWILTPAVFNQITLTYVDAAVAFYTLLGFCLLRLFQGTKSLVLFGIIGYCFGMTISIKFIMAAFIAPFWILWFIKGFVTDRKKIGGFLLAFSAGMALSCGYWFIRNGLMTGNPVFPYFGDLFGTPGLSNLSRYMEMGLSRTVFNFILAPFYLTFVPQLFGLNHWLGPCYLVLLPFAIISFLKNRDLRSWVAFIFLYYTVWFFLAQSVRYLIPILPLSIVVGFDGIGISIGKRSLLRRIMKIGLLASVFGLLGLGIYHFRFDLKVLLGTWTQDQYLRNLERSYPVATWMKTHLPSDAKVFNIEEIRQFYFEQVTTREEFFELQSDYAASIEPSQWLSFLKKRGYSYILWTSSQNASPSLVAEIPRMRLWNDILKREDGVKLIASIPSENIRESRVTYKVYEIS